MGALRFPGFGERLAAAMLAAGYITQAGRPDVPRFLARYRFDPRNFYPWLRGTRTPELETLTRLAAALDVPRAWLLLGDGPDPTVPRPARPRRTPAPIAGGAGATVPADRGPQPVGPETAEQTTNVSYRTWRFLWEGLLPRWTPTAARA